METKLYSYHTFMFPFQWDFIEHQRINQYSSYSARTNMKQFDKIFSKISELKKTPFQINNSSEKYNEFTYFHPFVRKALFYTNDNDLMYYYELEENDGEFNIEYFIDRTKNTKRTLNLKFDSICMHLYETGVGVVSYNISNFNYPEKEDILKINEFGRRIYPQYLKNDDRLASKGTFLPEKISGKIGNLTFSDDFSSYNSSLTIDSVFLPPDHIKKVFGYKGNDKLGDNGMTFVFRDEDERKGTVRIKQITDDRMFFLCYYENADLVNKLANKKNKEKNIKPKEIIYSYELDSFWYAYTFGDKDDKDPTIKDDKLQYEQINQHSYSRWIDYKSKNDFNGSLYGMTKDSFVCLGGWDELAKHMQSMYYQMAILCLVQRASILRFSYEVTQVTNYVFGKRNNAFLPIKELYENYIKFINQIYFREVTAQIQGIEMYAKFQDAMGLEKNVKDLDGEVEELFHYLDIIEQRKLNKTANLFLPIAVLTAFLGMNTFNEDLLKIPISTIIPFIQSTIPLSAIINLGLLIWIIYVIIKTLIPKK